MLKDDYKPDGPGKTVMVNAWPKLVRQTHVSFEDVCAMADIEPSKGVVTYKQGRGHGQLKSGDKLMVMSGTMFYATPTKTANETSTA